MMKLNSQSDRKNSGFTLLEMAFVLLVMGIIVSMLIPTASGIHNKSKIEEDRKVLNELKDSIIGQFLASGKLPACVTTNSPGNCDTKDSVGNLGIRYIDSHNRPIKYDVADVAMVGPSGSIPNGLTATSPTDVCATLTNAVNTPVVGGPSVCAESPNYDDNNTWYDSTYYCRKADAVAFVLVATGSSQPSQTGEVAMSSSSVLGNRNIGTDRVFENPGRRQNEPWHYDDLVDVVTFRQLLTVAYNNKFCAPPAAP